MVQENKFGQEYYGKKIVKAKFDDNTLCLDFESGEVIDIFDDGHTCCENRYMSTDDNVDSLVGGNLVGINLKEGPTEEGEYDVHEYDVHECEFMEIQTDKGFITFASHNEHNGYYGGIHLTIRKVEK